MKRTAIYIRVSSAVQAKEGDSIPAQRDALHKYIDSRPDLICVGEYLDDGISGTKEDRDELQRMLSDVKVGKIDLIIVTKLDRLYRNIRHYLNLQDTLDKAGVNWTAIWEPIYDTSTPQGRLIINQMMSIAQFEAENTGQRIRQVQAYKVAKGEVISGSTPPGYTIINKRLVPDENADTVREMFKYYSLHGNLNATIRRFDHTGIFPRSKPAYKQILKNEKYIGKFRGNDNFCEPIIDRTLFEDVQRKITMNIKSSQKRVYIFSGLIKCGECSHSFGGHLYTKKRTNGVKKLKTYRCPKRYGNSLHACPNCKIIYENVLEKYLLENIRPMLQDVVLTAELAEAPVKSNKDRIKSLEQKLNRLKELYVNDLISLDEYKIDRETIQAEITSLTEQEAPRNVPIDAISELLNQPFENLYTTFTDEEKRFFWRSIIKEIRFGLDRKYNIIFL